MFGWPVNVCVCVCVCLSVWKEGGVRLDRSPLAIKISVHQVICFCSNFSRTYQLILGHINYLLHPPPPPPPPTKNVSCGLFIERANVKVYVGILQCGKTYE